MYQEVTFNTFCDGFTGNYKDSFSYQGKLALFEYLEGLEEDTGDKIEFDPVALCCEYSEYESLDEIKVHYEDIKDMEDLEANTQVIEFAGGIIIQDF